MCGIVGYVGKGEKTLSVLLAGLKHLEYRGYDSAGVAYLNKNNELIIKKEEGRVKKLEDSLDLSSYSNIGIGHTRWATHGVANKANSHPHNVNKITVVHNGIIENYLELKEMLINKGYVFKSETDTEVGAALLDYLYSKNNDMIETIKEFKKMVIGAYALGIINSDILDTMYVVKKNSPLIIGVKDEEKLIASDVPAIIEETNKYIILDDGDFAEIKKNNIELYDKNNRKKSIIINTFENENSVIDKNGYEHFMKKEIYEQPEVIRKTSNTYIPNIEKYKRIVIVACGSAMHAGMVGKNLIERYGNIPVDVEIASEFRYKKLFLDDSNLVIAISQSGETADTLEAVKIAKNEGAYTLGIINTFESSIAREVDKVIYTKAGPEIAVATTKGYTSQVEVLSMIAYLFSKNNKDISYKKELREYMNDLKELPDVMNKVLENEKI